MLQEWLIAYIYVSFSADGGLSHAEQTASLSPSGHWQTAAVLRRTRTKRKVAK